MQNPDFRGRLELLIGEEKPFSWASRVGISKGAFTRIWNEGTMPKPEHLQKIKRATGASLDWLVDGEGEPPESVMKIDSLRAEANLAFLEGDDEKYEGLMNQIAERREEYYSRTGQQIVQDAGFSDSFALIPKHDVRVSGGDGATINSEQLVDYFAFSRLWLRKRGLNERHLVLVEVVGDSMYPVLSSGDTVLVDTSKTGLKTGTAYVVRIGDELLVKYVQRMPGERILISSENRDAYPSFEITPDQLNTEVTIIGRVVNSSRNW